MEKIIVKSWNDLEGYVICEDAYIVGEKHKRRSYGGCVFKVNSLESCVNIMNVLGGNFEYKEIEVIDTFAKFEKFLRTKGLFYSPIHIFKFGKIDMCREKVYNCMSIKETEEEFDVDLKILKED